LRLKLFHLQGSKISKVFKEIFGIKAWKCPFNFGIRFKMHLPEGR